MLLSMIASSRSSMIYRMFICRFFLRKIKKIKKLKKIKTIVALSGSCWEDIARDIIFDKNHLSLSSLTSLST